MALPKINTPTYELVVPSTDEKIEVSSVFGKRRKDIIDCNGVW